MVVQVARLAVADKERVEGARAAAAHAYYSQFTFQPVINERSKQFIRVSALISLHRCCLNMTELNCMPCIACKPRKAGKHQQSVGLMQAFHDVKLRGMIVGRQAR